MIACCADHRICVENNATLGVPEVVVGVPFPISALEVMRASVPPQHLRRITLQGPILPPERALAQGLVDSLVDADTLEDRALSAARSLAALPTASFAMSKTDLWRPFLDRMRAADKQRMIDAWCSEAVQGAIRRYVEKTLRR
ncbi:MAG: enoyl-CoA hydratase-related protein [Planctomycetota bacterium]